MLTPVRHVFGEGEVVSQVQDCFEEAKQLLDQLNFPFSTNMFYIILLKRIV